MDDYINVGACAIRTKVGDFDHNVTLIKSAITKADDAGVNILNLPELAITGYGLLDLFLSPDIHDMAQDALRSIVNFVTRNTTHLVVCVGMPVLLEGGQLYNGVAVISSNKGLQGITCKKNLALNGIHYESRWFKPWQDGFTYQSAKYNTIIGDLTYNVNGIKFGFEICEDSWVPNRAARQLYDRHVDIILNPSASHFAIGKYNTRKQFVKEGSRAFGAVYVYSNLAGNEEGQAIYDAGCMIASAGEIINQGKRLSFEDVDLIVSCIDVVANRVMRQQSSQQIDLTQSQKNTIELGNVLSLPLDKKAPSNTYQAFWEQGDDEQLIEASYAMAIGFFDWQNIYGLNGSVVSLSGGADSSITASIVYLGNILAYKELGHNGFIKRMRESGHDFDYKNLVGEELIKNVVMKEMLVTVYQGTKNSSNTTKNAAKTLGEYLGAVHVDWTIDDNVESYVGKYEQAFERKLSWETDDISLQNIQARSRAPGAWLIANIQNKSLLCTSCLTESGVGYTTLGGDLSGGLALISGVYKSRILAINEFLAFKGIPDAEGGCILIEGMQPVVKLKPSAELRPEEQTDEDDLMPFDILESIITVNIKEHRMPLGILKKLSRDERFTRYNLTELGKLIEKMFTLYGRSQIKRHQVPAGLHIEEESLDPKTFSKVPLMNHWVKCQLVKMHEYVKLHR